MDYINKYSWVAEVEFYADYEIDTPLFTPKVLEIEFLETEPEQEIEEPTTCTGNGVGCNVTEPEVDLNTEVSFDSNTLVPDATEQPGEVGTQFSFVNAVSGKPLDLAPLNQQVKHMLNLQLNQHHLITMQLYNLQLSSIRLNLM